MIWNCSHLFTYMHGELLFCFFFCSFHHDVHKPQQRSFAWKSYESCQGFPNVGLSQNDIILL